MRITKFHKPILLTVIGLACLGLLLLAPKQASAANPTTINFQGKIVNAADGTNIATPTGTYSIVFRIYNTSSPTMTTACSATASCLWQETQASVQLTNGIFQVELGSACALTSSSCNNTAGGPINFANNNSLYLTMQFNGDTSGANGGFMSPLIHITSVPFALQADNAASLGGIGAANYVQLATGTVQADSSSNDSISINKTGASGNIATFQSGNTTVFAIGNTGALTLTPKGNNIGTIIRQTSGTATSGNIFDIQGANGTSHFIQVAETAANAGSISITSLGSNAVTIDSGSGTVIYGSNTTTIQKTGSAFTLDVSNGASNSQLNISNSGGAGNITLNLDSGGSYAVGGTAGTTASACSAGQFVTGALSGGIVTSGSCGTPNYSTVQDEGTNLTQRSTINFTGAGVTCADNVGSTRTDCTISGGGGTFATTYSTTSQASNTVTYSNSGGGALILQNASTPLTTLFTIQNNAATFNYLTVTLSSSIPHLQIYGASSSNYADIYYDAGTSTAIFKASTGTTQVGNAAGGAINIASGSGNAITITGGANSTYTTSAGYIRLDGPSGIQFGTSGSANGLISFINLTNSNLIGITAPSGASAPGASYNLTLPSSAGSPNQCLQNSGTAGILTFSSCGSGSGTALSVNGTAVGSTGNLQNTTGTTSVAGTTFTNTSGNITLTVAAAGTGASGIVTATGTQNFDGNKVFSGSVTVQSATGIAVGTTSNVGNLALFNGTNSVSVQGASSTTAYTITLPAGVAAAANRCLTSTGANGTLQWLSCGAGSTATITLTPEYPGAVMTPANDGFTHTGTMTSDYCGNSGGATVVEVNTSVCASGQYHNYYSWTGNATNYYDVFTLWQAPSDFSSLSSITLNGWTSSASDAVSLRIYKSATSCGATGTITTAGVWGTASPGTGSCTIAAGDKITLDVTMKVGVNNEFARAGEITITYNRN